MLPSLVTCPTRIVVISRRLAASIIEAVTSRIWVTPPAAPSASAEDSVCTESMMVSCGLISSICPSAWPRSDSAAT